MTSDRLYYLQHDLFLPLNKLQNPVSDHGGHTQALYHFLLVDIRIAMIFFYFLLDSVITAVPHSFGVENY